MTNRVIITPPPIPEVSTDAEVVALIDAHDLDSTANTDGIEATADETYIKSFVDEDYIGNVIGMQLVAYCSVNPNKGTPGEFAYRSGNRRGLKVFWATGGTITLERSDAGGDDYIGTAAWLPTSGYVIRIHHAMIEVNSPNRLVATAWTSGSSPNTGLSGYMSYHWYNANTTKATVSPTANDNGYLSFEVWKPKT